MFVNFCNIHSSEYSKILDPSRRRRRIRVCFTPLVTAELGLAFCMYCFRALTAVRMSFWPVPLICEISTSTLPRQVKFAPALFSSPGSVDFPYVETVAGSVIHFLGYLSSRLNNKFPISFVYRVTFTREMKYRRFLDPLATLHLFLIYSSYCFRVCRCKIRTGKPDTRKHQSLTVYPYSRVLSFIPFSPNLFQIRSLRVLSINGSRANLFLESRRLTFLSSNIVSCKERQVSGSNVFLYSTPYHKLGFCFPFICKNIFLHYIQ